MKAPTATPADSASEVWVERDDDKIVDEGVVGHDAILGIGEFGVTRADDYMSAPLEQAGDRLDHVLVGEER